MVWCMFCEKHHRESSILYGHCIEFHQPRVRKLYARVEKGIVKYGAKFGVVE